MQIEFAAQKASVLGTSRLFRMGRRFPFVGERVEVARNYVNAYTLTFFG
jgi:hypothetical protein